MIKIFIPLLVYTLFGEGYMACFEKPLTFPSAGYELSAFVHIPSIGSRFFVLMLHGFTGNKVEANRLFVDVARALCKVGVSVFRFDYRCHGDSPLDFEEFRFEYALEDAENALAYVANGYRPERIIVLGLSMGGHIAARLAAAHGDRLAGAILLSPAINFAEIGKAMERFVAEAGDYYILGVFGPYRIRKEGLLSFSKYNALELVDKITIPVLIIHAKNDEVVPYIQSQQFYEKLASKDKKLVLLDEGGHVFSTYKSKTVVISEIVTWVKEKMGIA